jgi:beta-galactosidase
LRLTPDRPALQADGEDLGYILVEAVDADGVLCPLAMHEVAFAVDGPATIAGVGNGDHHFPHAFDADRVPLFYGKAMLILHTKDGAPGTVSVTASSNGLQPAAATVHTTPPPSQDR